MHHVGVGNEEEEEEKKLEVSIVFFFLWFFFLFCFVAVLFVDKETHLRGPEFTLTTLDERSKFKVLVEVVPLVRMFTPLRPQMASQLPTRAYTEGSATMD